MLGDLEISWLNDFPPLGIEILHPYIWSVIKKWTIKSSTYLPKIVKNMVLKLVIFQYRSLIFSPTINIIWVPFMINEFTVIV